MIIIPHHLLPKTVQHNERSSNEETHTSPYPHNTWPTISPSTHLIVSYIPNSPSHLIILNTNFRSVITAIRAAMALEERILSLVVGPAVRVENTLVQLVVQILVPEEAKLLGGRTLDLGLVYVQHGQILAHSNLRGQRPREGIFVHQQPR